MIQRSRRSIFRQWLSSTALAITAAQAAFAQQTPDAGRVIVGIAVDSVYGRALRNAMVRIGETGVSGVSDSSGRFRITGIPAGQHRVQVIHPLLDTLRLLLRTTPREFGDSTSLVLSTPSAATLVALKCTPEERALGNAMAAGFVTFAGTDEPAEGAVVRVEWTDYEVSGKRLRSVGQSRTGTVGADGSYKICGIPSDLETGVFAIAGDDTTTAVLTSFRGRLSITSFRVASRDSAAGSAASADGRTSGGVAIRGRVVDSTGRAVPGARVATEDGRSTALTQADGTFELPGLRPGTRSINIRRIGFLPVRRPVDVGPQGAQPMEIRLAVYVPVLETVRISARREVSLERVGFASRRKSSVGRFIGPDEIQKRNPYRLNEMLRMVPMLQTYYVNGETIITGRRNECVRYFLDGQRWFDVGDTPDRFVTGNELGAIEVYTSNSTPAEFIVKEHDGTSCTVVVIWTKWKLRM